MNYTQQDLDDFIAFIPKMNGDKLHSDFAACFLAIGWLRQTNISPRHFEITAGGQRQLDAQLPTR